MARPRKELRLCQRQRRRKRRWAAEEAELRGAVVLGERVRPRQPVHLARRPQDQPRADPRAQRAADPRLGGARPQQHEAATGMMESLVVVGKMPHVFQHWVLDWALLMLSRHKIDRKVASSAKFTCYIQVVSFPSEMSSLISTLDFYLILSWTALTWRFNLYLVAHLKLHCAQA